MWSLRYVGFMVALTSYLHAQRFSSRLRTLRQTYEETQRRLHERRSNAIREQADHYNRAAAGEEETGVYDEQGVYLHEKLDEYGFLIDDLGLMASENRKGAVIQLYHLWERSVQTWIKTDTRPNHDKLVTMAQHVGVPGDLARMEELRSVVNTLKHDNPDRLADLRKVRPDLIDEYHDADIGIPTPYERVAISHAHMIDFFDLVLSCGPPTNSGEWPNILPAPVTPYAAWRARDYAAEAGV